jgi:AraC-like DNA-binding protein
MRLAYEHIELPADCSWGFFYNRLEACPFSWHCHPEHELTLTVNARGLRYVGDSIAPFEPDDLVLLGPNLPHSWCSESRIDESRPLETYVLWFSAAWVESLTESFAEYRELKALFEADTRGLLFSSETGGKARALMKAMPRLAPRPRFARMLEVLDLLSADHPGPLASPHITEQLSVPRREERLVRVLDYLHEHYMEPLCIPDVAAGMGMSQSALFRLFKGYMHQSVSDYVTALRIGRACALLLENDDPVYLVAENVGYQNLSNFNRRFRALKGLSPRDFRREFPWASARDGPEASLDGLGMSHAVPVRARPPRRRSGGGARHR